MGAAVATMSGINVSDVSGQKQVKVTSITKESTIGDLVQGILGKMGLPRNDGDGRPLLYRARLAREARHLDARETVGDALKEEDELSLHPNVDAGAGRSGRGGS